jgi:hypothetical protein
MRVTVNLKMLFTEDHQATTLLNWTIASVSICRGQRTLLNLKRASFFSQATHSNRHPTTTMAIQKLGTNPFEGMKWLCPENSNLAFLR